MHFARWWAGIGFTSSKPNSAGLGLWLASAALAASGGGLSVENIGSGARVTLVLPIHYA